MNSQFPDLEKASTFKAYFESKYDQKDLNTENPLLEVKIISSHPKNYLLPVNFIVPKSKNKVLVFVSYIKKASTRENVLLPIEVCELFPVPPNIYEMAFYLPSIMWRLETLLLAKDCQFKLSKALISKNDSTSVQNLELDVKTILNCISAPGCQEDFCYERLEILGTF